MSAFQGTEDLLLPSCDFTGWLICVAIKTGPTDPKQQCIQHDSIFSVETDGCHPLDVVNGLVSIQPFKASAPR